MEWTKILLFANPGGALPEAFICEMHLIRFRCHKLNRRFHLSSLADENICTQPSFPGVIFYVLYLAYWSGCDCVAVDMSPSVSYNRLSMKRKRVVGAMVDGNRRESNYNECDVCCQRHVNDISHHHIIWETPQTHCRAAKTWHKACTYILFCVQMMFFQIKPSRCLYAELTLTTLLFLIGHIFLK